MKNLTWLVALLPFLLLPIFGLTQVEGADPLIEKIEQFEGGKIDWTNQFIEVSGTAIQNFEKHKDSTQRVELAKRAALLVAKANLLEIVEGVNVYRETTVEDLMLESDILKAKVEGRVKGARQFGKAVVAGSSVTVTVRMPLAGTQGLAPILIGEVKKRRERENSSSAEAQKEEETEPSSKERGGSEQVVLNIKDLGDGKFDPKMFPVIVDEDGNVIVDYSELYEKYGGNLVKYVKIADKLINDVNWKKGKEIVDAIQNPDGSIKIDTKKHPKFRKILKKAWKLGKFLLPLIL